MLHCCWLVDPWRPTRERYLHAWGELGPLTLWHAGQLEREPLHPVTLRDARELFQGSVLEQAWAYELRHRNHAACADLLRYEALYQLGGAYFDLDVLPHPAHLDKAAFASICAQDFALGSHGESPEIRFIFSRARHPALERVRHLAAERTRAYIESGGHAQGVTMQGVLTRTGPFAMADALRDFPQERRRWLRPCATLNRTVENSLHFHRRFGEIDAVAGCPATRHYVQIPI